MVFVIRVEIGQILGITAGLVVFGIFFNMMTAWLERKGYIEGITSLIVALGVAITLAPFALFSVPFVLMIFGGFIASGSPMIIGSISRYLKNRERAQKELMELHSYGNDPQDLAR